MRGTKSILAVSLLVGATLGGGPAFGQTTVTDGADNGDTIYLSTSFRGNGEDGLRFLYSTDGYHWTNVPGTFLKPRVGPSQLMRDPSLIRGPDGTFHLVWTTGWHTDQGFGYASSRDLVHWSEQKFVPVMAYEPTTVNVWAPELFYDEPNGRFIICWASTIPGRFPDYQEERRNNHRMYYTTTRDFKTFTPTKLFFDPDFSIIDCTIVRDQNRYVLVLKDNSRPQRNLRVAFCDSPLGPWRDVSEPFTSQFTEGPSVLKIGDDWIIYFDAYRANIYGAVKTRDFKTFTDITKEVSFPEGHKHGTVLRVGRKDLDRLIHTGEQQVPGVRLPLVSALSEQEIERRLAAIDAVARRGPFQPDWQSLAGFQTPAWYRDAKFGIFIHWGAYSVPAFGNEWYPRNMYRTGSGEFKHHVATYGPQSQFGYKDLIAQFKAEEFDASRWAKLFKEAGARYVIPVAEHHDGFPMYNSDCTDWCAAKTGPGRDVIGRLADALRREGIVFGASSHRAEHWWFFDQGMYFDSDVRDPGNAALYGPASNQRVAESQSEPPDKAFLDDWLLRSCEIVDKYQPQVVYFDWWIGQPVFQPYLKRFAAYYYNRGAEWNKPVAINYKEWEGGRSFPDGTGVFDIERGQSADIRPDFWQTCTSVSKNSWGYITNQQYKEVGSIVDDLVDIVSKNGTMLLNIGPKADGTIPEHEQQMLRAIGGWLRTNSEAIYGTRPWKKFGEGPTQVVAGSFADVKRQAFTGEDFRFTTKGNVLYAIALAWPRPTPAGAHGKLVVKSLAPDAGLAQGRIENVRLLGYEGKLDWRQTADGLVVTLPERPPCDYAVTLAITGLQLDLPSSAHGQAMILDPADYAHWVENFNSMEDEGVVNLIPNAQAWQWIVQDAPLFSCPSARFEEIYYFRWWTFRKHICQTPDGLVLTEFIKPVGHAGPYNTVSCAYGHHVAEGRWLRDQRPLDEYTHFWFRSGEGGGPAWHFHKYSSWAAAALYDRYLVTLDRAFLVDLLDDLVADYAVWESERGRADGLFWQYDVRDGMEESISGSREAKNIRPTINSYMAANARAIARIARLAGRADVADEFAAKAEALRAKMIDAMWDPEAKFFKVRFEEGAPHVGESLRDSQLAVSERLPHMAGLSDAREEIGYIPWMFGLAGPEHAAAWLQIKDPAGFWAPWGLTTAERRHPKFRTHGTGGCEWDGAVWPFATSQTLTGLANVLRGPQQPYVTRRDYFEQLLTYARAHQMDGKAYIGEYQDETTGKWLITGPKAERSRYYNHSTFNDLVITGLVGLVPREDATVEVDPLIPEGDDVAESLRDSEMAVSERLPYVWDWFCLDGVPYHGHELTIVWDRTGRRYGRGAGLAIWADGQEIARSPKLGRLTGTLPSGAQNE